MTGARPSRGLARHAILMASALVVAGPFVWTAVAAFRTQISLMIGEALFTPTLVNFDELLFSPTSNFLNNYVNSAFVATAVTALAMATAVMAAYSLTRMAWPRWMVRLILFWAIVFQMLPPITLVGAWFYMLRAVGLDSTFTGLVLAHTTLNLPMALWLMAIYVADVPRELEEAARVDGASAPTIFLRIILPLVRPGLAAASILVFISSWNEFAVALNITSQRTATVPVAIASFAQEYVIQYSTMAAGATLSVLPALLLLVVGQRYIVRGVTAGALK